MEQRAQKEKHRALIRLNPLMRARGEPIPKRKLKAMEKNRRPLDISIRNIKPGNAARGNLIKSKWLNPRRDSLDPRACPRNAAPLN